MAIIKCPECGHQISDSAKVCPSCGVKIVGYIVKCNRCGEVYFKDNGICPNCYSPMPHDNDNEETPSANTEVSPIIEETAETEGGSTPSTTTDTPSSSEESLPETTSKEEEVPESEDFGDEEESPLTPSTQDSGEDTSVPQEDLQEKDENLDDAKDNDPDDDSGDITYIDTDEENLEKPVHVSDDSDIDGQPGKYSYIPVIVSLAIAALIAAVCLYFYNDSKTSTENKAFELAIKSGDVNEMNNFLRNFVDANSDHKKAIKDQIASITKQRDDLAMSLVTRDKSKIQQFLKDYPDTPQREKLLAMLDSIDWEEAQKTNTKTSYEQYLAAHANGIFFKEAKDKITIKEIAATAEDAAKAKSLFREFFLSVNGNDVSRLTGTLPSNLTSFMGTSNASAGDVVSWMKQQHKEDVSNVIWSLNHDYKIVTREQNEIRESTIDFTGKRSIKYKDGRFKTEHFKITSTVNGNNKITSMSMTSYVPKAGEQTTSSSNSKPSSSSGNSSSSKPSTSSNGNKSASSGNSSSKPSTTSSSKPSNTSTSSSKPASSSTAKPSSASNSKPASASTSKPSSTSSSKPASASTSKPSSTSSSKPASASTAKTSSTSSSKPASSNTAKPSSTSSSKPASTSTAKPASSNQGKSTSTSKPASK